MTTPTNEQCDKVTTPNYRCWFHKGHDGACRLEYAHRMDAYYYSFEPTGIDVVDRILSAVASAGKGFHHTESWGDEVDYLGGVPAFRGTSYVEWIQNAANDAAEAFRQKEPSR